MHTKGLIFLAAMTALVAGESIAQDSSGDRASREAAMNRRAATNQLGSAAPVNVLIEGSFEDLRSNGEPSGWALGGFIGGNHRNRITVETEGTGHFLRLSILEPENRLISAATTLPVSPDWKRIVLSARMRNSGYVPGRESWHDQRVLVEWLDAQGKTVGQSVLSLKEATAVWTDLRREFSVPLEATSAKVSAVTFGAAGLLDFDDIAIVPSP